MRNNKKWLIVVGVVLFIVGGVLLFVYWPGGSNKAGAPGAHSEMSEGLDDDAAQQQGQPPGQDGQPSDDAGLLGDEEMPSPDGDEINAPPPVPGKAEDFPVNKPAPGSDDEAALKDRDIDGESLQDMARRRQQLIDDARRSGLGEMDDDDDGEPIPPPISNPPPQQPGGDDPDSD
jgi:hypothetical protein